MVNESTFSEAGYKLLMEILVKVGNAKVKEIPYTFTDRKSGRNKLDSKVILDYEKPILHLYAFKNSKSIRDKQRKVNLDRKANTFIKN